MLRIGQKNPTKGGWVMIISPTPPLLLISHLQSEIDIPFFALQIPPILRGPEEEYEGTD